MSTKDDDPIILPLADALDERQCGGKAVNLARLQRLRIAVPDGFVVTDAARRLFLDAGALQPLIDGMREGLDAKSPVGVRAAAETIAAIVRAEALPNALREALDEASARLGAPLLIARSSAAGEDSRTASFAGQLDSIPGVSGPAALHQAVVDVWVSRWSARVLTYERTKGHLLSGVGVVVQRQVDAEISGVLFTRAPGAPDDMLLEYCGGLGEALVSGREDPGRLTIARESGAWSEQAVPERPVARPSLLLNDWTIGEIARTARAIEEEFGAPQDIEWTIDRDGTLWFVQARPITVTGPATGPAVVWSNANVNENFPAPISPLLYSIAREGYYHYFRNLGAAFGISRRRLAAMDAPLRQIIGVHGARMYYNLSNIHAVLRAAPFGERLAAAFNDFVGAEHVSPPAARESFAARARSRAAHAAELAVIAAKTAWQYARLTRRVERFERTVDRFAAGTRPESLASRPASALLEDFRGFRDIRCRRWNDAALADTAAMVCYAALKGLLARACPGDDQQALHNSLLKALPDLVSSRPPLELWRLSRAIRADRGLSDLFATASSAEVLSRIRHDDRFVSFRQDFDRYLEEFGFRCSAELMLTVPSFQEAPEPVIDLLRSYTAMTGESPADILERQQRQRLEETARVLSTLSWRRPIVSIVLRWTQKAIQLRERARLKQALLYSRLRRIALALGSRLVERGRLAAIDDVFFLTGDELDALVSGAEMFPNHVQGLVALRQSAHAEVTRAVPPDTIRLEAGEYATTTTPAAAPLAGIGGSLNGLGACGGTTTGRATVLADVTESHLLSRGDILVTRQTDPGWGPIFPLISGLVMERGGMLSHGAIIAREFGIPSVVGVAGATRRIASGGTVTVDGDRGLVYLEAHLVEGVA